MRRSLDLLAELGDLRWTPITLNNLGNVELAAGDVDAARRHLEESARLARLTGNEFTLCWALFTLVLACVEQDELTAAEAHLDEVAERAARLGYIGMTPSVLLGHALLASRARRHELAATLHGAADAELRRFGAAAFDIAETRLLEPDRERLRDALGACRIRAPRAARGGAPARSRRSRSRARRRAKGPRTRGRWSARRDLRRPTRCRAEDSPARGDLTSPDHRTRRAEPLRVAAARAICCTWTSAPTRASGAPGIAPPAIAPSATGTGWTASTRVGYDYAHAIIDDHTRLAYVELHNDETRRDRHRASSSARWRSSPATASPPAG